MRAAVIFCVLSLTATLATTWSKSQEVRATKSAAVTKAPAKAKQCNEKAKACAKVCPKKS